MSTLSVLNFIISIPAMIYFSLVNSLDQGRAEAFMAVIFSFTMMVCLAGVSYLTAMIRGIKPDQRHVFAMTVMFHNSGNYGLSLQDLAFGPRDERCRFFIYCPRRFPTSLWVFSWPHWFAKKGRI
jgi:predicted permease